MDFGLLLLIFSLLILQSYTYDTRCPTKPEWNNRAKICNITGDYVCLLDDLKMNHTENCTSKREWEAPGREFQYRGNFNGRDCDKSRYQPYIFWTNGSSECEFLKSLCPEEGQICFSDGETYEDRRCRCDYTNGYAFVQEQFNQHYCLPAFEDCSCYIKQCNTIHTVLTSDYHCRMYIATPDPKMLSTCEIDSILQFPRPLQTTQIELPYIKELHWFHSNSKFTNLSGKRTTEQKLFISTLICLAIFVITGTFQRVFTSESYIPREIETKKNIEEGMSKNSVPEKQDNFPLECQVQQPYFFNQQGIAIKFEAPPKTETDIVGCTINSPKIESSNDSPDNICREGMSEVWSETEPESMNSDAGFHDLKQDDIKSQETEHLDKNTDINNINSEYEDRNQQTDTKIVICVEEQSDNNFAAVNNKGSNAEPIDNDTSSRHTNNVEINQRNNIDNGNELDTHQPAPEHVTKLNGHQVEQTANKSEKREIQKHRSSSSTVQIETTECIPPENTRAVPGDCIINGYIDIRTKTDLAKVTTNYLGLENGHIGSEISPQTENCWGDDLRSDRPHGQKQGDVNQIHLAGNDVIDIRSELDYTRSKFPQQIQQSDTRLENKAKNIDTKNKIYTAEKKQDSHTVDKKSFIHRTDLLTSEQNDIDNENQYRRSSNVVVLNDPQVKHTVNKSEKVEMPRHRSPSTVLTGESNTESVEDECMSAGARCLNDETELYKATASPSIEKGNYTIRDIYHLHGMLLEKENVKKELEIKKLELEIELLNKQLIAQPHQFKK